MSDWIIFGERLSHVMREYDKAYMSGTKMHGGKQNDASRAN